MALIQGIHILGKRDKGEARRIAIDVQQNQRLLVGTNTLDGAGAYAWYVDRFPHNLRDDPQVLFEIDDTAVIECCKRNGESLGYFRIPGAIGDYVSIRVLAFTNVWQ
jgi:hypothetical protein